MVERGRLRSHDFELSNETLWCELPVHPLGVVLVLTKTPKRSIQRFLPEIQKRSSNVSFSNSFFFPGIRCAYDGPIHTRRRMQILSRCE